MSLKFKTSDAASDSLNQLLQLSRMYKLEDAREQAGFMTRYNDFTTSASSYDNEKLLNEKEVYESYLAQHRDDMDDITLERFEVLGDTFDKQYKSNVDYDMFMRRHSDKHRVIFDLASKMNQADGLYEFTYNTVSYNRAGERIETPHTVSEPKREEFGFTDWDSWNVGELDEEGRSAKEIEYHEIWNNWKDEILPQEIENYKQSNAQEIERQILSYVKDKKDFLLKHSDRVGNPYFNYDFKELETTEGILNFALQSATDDGIFDSEEKTAYMRAIGTSNPTYITDFIAKDKQINTALSNSLATSIQENYKAVEDLFKHKNIFSDVDVEIANPSDDWAKKNLLPSGIEIPISAEKVQSYTWQEVYDSLADKNEEDPLYQYYNSIQPSIDEFTKKIKLDDEQYFKKQGVSLLNRMESDDVEFNQMMEGASYRVTPNVPPLDWEGKKTPPPAGKTKEIEGDEAAWKWAVPTSVLGAKALAPQRLTEWVSSGLVESTKRFSNMWGVQVEHLEKFWKSGEASQVWKKLDEYDEILKKNLKALQSIIIIKV